MMKIVQNCFGKKLCSILKELEDESKVCILFNHGLGDFINFCPLFDFVVKIYPKLQITLGFNSGRNYVYLHPKGKIIDTPYGKYEGEFDLLVSITYPDPPRKELMVNYYKNMGIENPETITKVELCNEMEIGLKDFKWNPYKLKRTELKYNKNSKRIGIHFFGYALASDKNVDMKTAEIIWNEIIKVGYEPFEIHMIHTDYLMTMETPEFINRENSLRFEFPNVRIMSEEISKCKYFIGIDSGPFYLASSILGFDKCIGLEKNLKFAKIVTHGITSINVNDYRSGSVADMLGDLDDTR